MSQPLHELRILILGDGAVGKTSLLRQLVSGEPARLGEDKTAGIAIARWPLSVRGVNVTAHVWDFGGQGEMHAAHPYFFGRRTLYLLVVEGRQDHLIKERLGYWLQMVQSHGGHDARVLVVQNKADQHQAALVEQDWRARHAGLPASGAFHAVSCLTGRGVDGLCSAILAQVEAMPSVWEKWPASWLAVKAALAQRLSPPQPVLSLEEGCRLCAGEGIGDDIGQITLLKNLHDLGAIVAYPGDARLAALGIMDPVWVKSGVYALLNHPQLIEQQGEAREDQLQELLGGLPGYSLRHCHGLLELMVKFELAFPTARGWILPGLLPPNALPQALAAPYTVPDKPLRFEFHYELLPETLITRFIARQHGRAAASATASWWRHGMLLQCEGCPALVQAQVGAHGRIRIAVAGQAGRRRDAMTLLRAAIEDLHSEPQREAVGRMVPLPEHPEVAVPYERLLHLEERNIKSDTVHHGRNPLTFLVSELLDGVGRPEEGNTYHIYNNHVHGLGATLVQAPVTGTLVAGNAVVDLSSSTTNLGAQG